MRPFVHPSIRRISVLTFACLACFALWTARGRAATNIVVNSTADTTSATDGKCTLREAITSANTDTASGAAAGECPAGSGTDTISFSVTGTITVGSTLPTISTSMTVSGPGATQLTVSGNNAVRVFNVFVTSPEVAALTGLTIANGKGSAGGGIVINSTGTVDVTNSTLSSNSANSNSGGGAISYMGAGILNVTGCTFSNNSADVPNYPGNVGSAGAIFNGSSGTINVARSTFSGNSNANAGGGGGGVFNSALATVNVTGSTFSDNSGSAISNDVGTISITETTLSTNSASSGGGIYNDRGAVNVTSSTLNGNTASSGGGIYNLSGTVNVSISTLSGNTASSSGGGIYNVSGQVTLKSVTLSGNLADGFGGGIFNAGGGGSAVRLSNTIVARNTAGSSGNDLQGPATTSLGYNLIGIKDGSTTIAPTSGDQFGTSASPIDPKLDTLKNNFGPTRTMALLFGSPALDKGKDPFSTQDISEDQRGFSRPRNLSDATYPNATGGDGSDIGAYEAFNEPTAPPNTAPAASATPNPAVTNEDTSVQITLKGTDAENNTLTFTITEGPTKGSLNKTVGASFAADSCAAGTCTAAVTYTPAANYNGSDSFKFKVNDATVDSNVVTVSVTVNPVADLSVSDVTRAEGNSGQTPFAFAVSLDSPAPAGGVTFNASTADGTGAAGSDYVALVNQPYTILEGQTSTTVDVQINGDTALEPNETFTVNITNVTNATISDGQGQGTILNDDGAPTAGQIIISEFRLRGPDPDGAGAETGQLDEFIELYNTTDSDFVVVDSSPLPALASRGWAIVSDDPLNTDPSELLTAKYVIPVGTTIPARGHFLVTNALGYSLSAYAPADTVPQEAGGGPASYNADIGDGSGLALYRTGNPVSFTPDNRLDAVGFTGSTLFEGTALTPTGGINTPLQHSFARKLTSGLPQDTQNNEADFLFVEVSGATSNGRTAILGAPGPENSQSPIQRNGVIKASLIDPTQPATAPPNRIRSGQIQTGGPNAFGTLTIRRRFTNTTQQTITRLRFRIVDITTLNSPGYVPGGPQADLRLINSATSPLNVSDPNGAVVLGTSLEEPPAQANGGGLNSSLGRSAIAGTLITASIAPGASVNVQFMLGVQQGGSFRFLVNVEALPGPATLTAGAESDLKAGGRKTTGSKKEQ